jgi:hypothetical protein
LVWHGAQVFVAALHTGFVPLHAPAFVAVHCTHVPVVVLHAGVAPKRAQSASPVHPPHAPVAGSQAGADGLAQSAATHARHLFVERSQIGAGDAQALVFPAAHFTQAPVGRHTPLSAGHSPSLLQGPQTLVAWSQTASLPGAGHGFTSEHPTQSPFSQCSAPPAPQTVPSGATGASTHWLPLHRRGRQVVPLCTHSTSLQTAASLAVPPSTAGGVPPSVLVEVAVPPSPPSALAPSTGSFKSSMSEHEATLAPRTITTPGLRIDIKTSP